MTIPTEEECLQLLKCNKVPENIIRHSVTVADLAVNIAAKIQQRGIDVNLALVKAASLLHDIKRLSSDHSRDGARFLKEAGFIQVAEIVRKHGLKDLNLGVQPRTLEEKIVFYADKRVAEDQIVSIRERFNLLKAKYSQVAQEIEETYQYVLDLEHELQRLCPDIID
jgi:putative nucleotidyltransferase with HDIG domain